MRQPNGCSTPAPRYGVAKQWLEELAQKMKNNYIVVEQTWATCHAFFITISQC